MVMNESPTLAFSSSSGLGSQFDIFTPNRGDASLSRCVRLTPFRGPPTEGIEKGQEAARDQRSERGQPIGSPVPDLPVHLAAMSGRRDLRRRVPRRPRWARLPLTWAPTGCSLNYP